jgi:uncharacterized membrane protein YhiD involved in acid resistance
MSGTSVRAAAELTGDLVSFPVMSVDWSLLLRVIVALVLAYIVGFERELRGSAAGDRTFALIGVAAAALTAAVGRTSPQAIAGIVTGVGFVGAAVLFRTDDALILWAPTLCSGSASSAR